MLRIFSATRQRVTGFAVTALLRNRATSFHPFSQRDEDDLVRVIKTKPRHVLKHVRQQVWRSRKRELHFRNTVTHLMIILQEFLRKQLIDPANASQIMEGVLEECVTYAQHDMAHLLFRAFLRFRKYGCVTSVNAIRCLFESYKSNDSSELMLQLANEMRGDAALRPLCIAAYLFANQEAEAEALQANLSPADLGKDDFIALIAGYDKLGNVPKLLGICDALPQRQLDPVEQSEVYEAAFRVFYKRDDDASLTHVLQSAVTHHAPLSNEAFVIILRHKMRHVTSTEEIVAIEDELKEMGYVPDTTGNAIVITAFARLMHFGDKGSEELMLSKVDTLLSSIESRLKQGDPDMDIGVAHVRAVIRGYGAAGKPEAIKAAWGRIQHKGLTNDVRVYNELFKWFALMGNVKDVLALKEEMERAGVNPDSLTYTWCLRAVGKYYPRHVEQLQHEIESRKIRPDVQLYNTLIGIFGDIGRPDMVEHLVTEMRKREESGTLQFTPITFAILIRVHSKNIDEASELYAEAKRRNLSDHPHVLTSMLHVLATNPEGGVDKVEAFLQDVPSWGTDVYNVLLNMYGKAKQRDKLDATLDKMKSSEVPMNDVTFGTLITAFARWGDAGKVHEIIQLLKDHQGEVSATFYSVLASSLSRMGNPEGVADAWDDLLASKLFPDTEVYNQFLVLYSRQHNIAKMQGVLDNMMRQVPPNPVTATTVLDMLGKSGRVAEMEALFEDMKSSPDTLPTSVTYHQMMNAYAKTGDVVKMAALHDEFIEKGHQNNAVTYNILMDGYGRAKLFEQMEEVLQKRKASGIPPDDLTYCIMVTAYGRARIEKEVKRLLHEVSAAAQQAVFTKRVLWSFMDAFCRCGHSEYVEQCVERIAAASSPPKLHVADITAIIPYFCRLGQMERVESLERDVQAQGGELSYSTLNAIARGYARVGKFDKTIETLHKLRDRQWVPDASTALQLSGAFLKVGLHEQAQQIIEWRRQYAKIAGEDNVKVEQGDAK